LKTFIPQISFRQAYDRFDTPATTVDCGQMCAPHNPSGKPFCCDICHAVPAAYRQEWAYLEQSTDLWRPWQSNDCTEIEPGEVDLTSDTPDHMLLLTCQGPQHCQRKFRAISCRQFPFIPYITADDRFIGLAYEWAFEATCWVISHLDQVLPQFRLEFVSMYDEIFALWPHDYESYAITSEQMRVHYAAQRRRIPVLHRNEGFFLISPGSDRMERVSARRLKRFGVYQVGE
jgi:hypothetical protein